MMGSTNGLIFVWRNFINLITVYCYEHTIMVINILIVRLNFE